LIIIQQQCLPPAAAVCMQDCAGCWSITLFCGSKFDQAQDALLTFIILLAVLFSAHMAASVQALEESTSLLIKHSMNGWIGIGAFASCQQTEPAVIVENSSCSEFKIPLSTLPKALTCNLAV
jgi:hypothetical protein